MKKILILGPGAIGLSVGAALLEAGKDVTFYGRQPFDCLKMSVSGVNTTFPATVITDPQDLHRFDWVLLCVKSHQVGAVADLLRAVVGDTTRVAILQNGVEHRENVEVFLPKTRLVPVIVDIPAKRLSPGVVERIPRDALLTVQDTPDGQAFCTLFDTTFVKATTVDDLVTRAWQKLCINAPAGAISALTGQTMGVFHQPGIVDIARAILSECVAIGRAEGAKLDDAIIDNKLTFFQGVSPDESNSMHQDWLAGRETEWNARNAVLVRKGRKYGIPTPVSDILVPLLASQYSESTITPRKF